MSKRRARHPPHGKMTIAEICKVYSKVPETDILVTVGELQELLALAEEGKRWLQRVKVLEERTIKAYRLLSGLVT